MIKRLIIALALGTVILLTANAQNSTVKDSLLRIYVTAPHDSMRLDVLHDIARLDQQTPVFLYYENKLLKEATEQNNLRYQSLATYEHIIYFFNKLRGMYDYKYSFPGRISGSMGNRCCVDYHSAFHVVCLALLSLSPRTRAEETCPL